MSLGEGQLAVLRLHAATQTATRRTQHTPVLGECMCRGALSVVGHCTGPRADVWWPLRPGQRSRVSPLPVRSSALAILTTRSIMSATAAAPQPAPVSPLRGLLIRHPLVSFFTLAYALTWLAWSPWYLSRAGVGLLPFDGEGISDYLNTVALIVGPTLSAFVMTGATEGREGVRGLLRRIVLWRVGL